MNTIRIIIGTIVIFSIGDAWVFAQQTPAGRLPVRSGSSFTIHSVPSVDISRRAATTQFNNRSPTAFASSLNSRAHPAKPLHSAIANSGRGVEAFRFGTMAGYWYTDGRLQSPRPIWPYPPGQGFLEHGWGGPPFYQPPSSVRPLTEPQSPTLPTRPLPRR